MGVKSARSVSLDAACCLLQAPRFSLHAEMTNLL